MKTISLKKVSAVAVASLGFGLLSVVPAQAAEKANASANGGITALTLAAVTATPTIGSPVIVKMGMSINAIGENPASADTYKMQGALTSVPSGGSVALASALAGAGAQQTGTLTPIIATAGTFFGSTPTASVVTFTAPSGGVVLGTYPAEINTRLSAQTVTNVGGYNFTPTKAGTYVLTVWQDTNGTGDTPSVGEIQQTLSITVAAAAGYSAALSTAFLAEDLTDDDTGVATAATNATDAPFQVRTLGAKAAQIVLVTRDTANAIYTGQAITATISGSGFVSAGSTAATAGAPTAAQANTGDGSATTTRTASVTGAANTTGVVTVGVWGDGTAGTGTVTISVTDQVSGATTTLATKTVTWYSATAATIEATLLQGRATAGVPNGCDSATACTQATLALTPAVVIVVKDSGGRIIPGLAVTGTPADTAVITSSTVTAVTAGNDKNGRGYYNASVIGGAAANVGKSTTIVYSLVVSSTLTISTAPITITNAGTPATVTWSLDKTSYAPGAPVVITVTAKDAGGNAVGDGTYTTLFAGASVLGGSITGSTPAASVEILGGVKTFTAFAPGNAGTYTVSNKFGASMPAALQGGAISVSIVVADSNAAANAALTTQIDSLNAKIVALTALIAKIMKSLKIK